MKTLVETLSCYPFLTLVFMISSVTYSQTIPIPVTKSKLDPVFSEMPPIAPGPFKLDYESLKA